MRDLIEEGNLRPKVNTSELRDECECPYCAELILRKAKVCKHCKRELSDTSREASALSVNIPPNREDGKIEVRFECGKQLIAKRKYLGKKVKCPKCNRAFVLSDNS